MDPFTVGVIGGVALIVLIAMGVHIAIALLAVGFVGDVVIMGFKGAIWAVTTSSYARVTNPAFLALPLFIFMGLLAGGTGLSRGLFNGLNVWLRRLKGGLGISSVFGCTAFGLVCGSSLVTAAVFGKVCSPEMRRYGYNKILAYGICTCAGMIGMLIPPSVMAVLYALVAEMSVVKLLIAGTVPGLLIAVLYSIYILVLGVVKPSMVGGGGATTAMRVTWRDRIVSLRLFWPVFVIAGIIFGGIFGGVFSANEAAAVAGVTMLLIAIFTPKAGRWSLIRQGTLDGVSIVAMIFFIFMGAAIFSEFMVVTGVSSRLVSAVANLGLSGTGFTIALAILYLVLGMFLDGTSMVCVTVPLVIPIARGLGIDLVWFAMISMLAMEIGVITPPVGVNLYAVKGVAEPDVSLEDIIRGIGPFFGLNVVSLGLLIAFPIMITILPNLMVGR